MPLPVPTCPELCLKPSVTRVLCPAGVGTEYQGDHMNKFVNLKVIALAGLVAISLMTTACNTVAGVGKDTSAAGKAVTEEANEHK
jgi:predicted small secreted protein